MNIEIICPLYNAENYLKNLDSSLKKQKNVNISKISYILTESKDNTKNILDSLTKEYSVVQPEEFSHSLTRETVALEIRTEDWLEKLIFPIISRESEASFSRQLTKYDNIEKYIREKNYPNNSYIISKNDIEKMGLRAFFFSDASSAIRTDIFKKLNGYDGKRLPTNEDQYIAYKLLMNNYKIKYCSDSVVYHSHKFSLKELYKRYYATGVFYKQENYIDKFGTTKTGGSLALYILKRAIQDKNWKVLIRFLPDMGVRFIGMKMGKCNGSK